ncbi:hypothetical protein B0H21DRAFT_719242 [Amylocystis lapponica]|nr:hypothetical protein B0H21DRAFT_719242 [Amylocystis lapponica]
MPDVTFDKLDMLVKQPPASPSPVVARTHKTNPTFIKPTADLLLISSDDVVFRVHKIILAEASPFFETIFTIPQSPQSETSTGERGINHEEYLGLPAIRMVESSDVLESLLRLSYPIDDPILADAGDVGMVLAAAIKYDMLQAINITKQRLLGFIQETPLRVYAIACFHHLEKVAYTAASAVSSNGYLQDTVPPTIYIAEMERITAGAYQRLVAFCKAPGRSTLLFDRADPYRYRDVPRPDLILRSSDNVNFLVHGSVLQIASPILRERIPPARSPNPMPERVSDGVDSQTSNLPVIQLAESRRRSQCSCSVIPVSDPVPLDLQELPAIFTAAQNYGINKALQFAIAQLENALETEPLRVYFIASQFRDADSRLPRIASKAAYQTLGQDVLSVYHREMEDVSAYVYYQLLAYHQDCRKAATALAVNYSWASSTFKGTSCKNQAKTLFRVDGAEIATTTPCWFEFFLSYMKTIMATKPLGTVIAAAATLQGIPALILSNQPSMCPECRTQYLNITTSMMKLALILAEEVDRGVGQVELKHVDHTVEVSLQLMPEPPRGPSGRRRK